MKHLLDFTPISFGSLMRFATWRGMVCPIIHYGNQVTYLQFIIFSGWNRSSILELFLTSHIAKSFPTPVTLPTNKRTDRAITNVVTIVKTVFIL